MHFLFMSSRCEILSDPYMVWFDCLFNNAVPVVGCSSCILLKASMVTQYHVHSHAALWKCMWITINTLSTSLWGLKYTIVG